MEAARSAPRAAHAAIEGGMAELVIGCA